MFRLAHLQHMSISNAGLMELPESISQLANLRSLELYDNPIGELPTSISRLGQLENLSIRSCPNLSELPKDLEIRNVDNRREGLVKLRQLELSHTGIRSLPKSLRYLKDLEKIRVTSSPLTAIDKDIHRLPNLQELDLCRCTHLREYPSISRGRPPLKKLILRDCSNLRTLPADIHKLNHLEELDLRGCSSLHSLPGTISLLPAACTIRVPAHLREQLNQLRAEALSTQTARPPLPRALRALPIATRPVQRPPPRRPPIRTRGNRTAKESSIPLTPSWRPSGRKGTRLSRAPRLSIRNSARLGLPPRSARCLRSGQCSLKAEIRFS